MEDAVRKMRIRIKDRERKKGEDGVRKLFSISPYKGDEAKHQAADLIGSQ